MYSESKLRKLLKDEGLPSHGDKATLVKRHTEWVQRYNANLDAAHPKSEEQVKRELMEWETIFTTASPPPFTPSPANHEPTPVSEEERKLHRRKYDEQYRSLIEVVKKRKRSGSGTEEGDTQGGVQQLQVAESNGEMEQCPALVPECPQKVEASTDPSTDVPICPEAPATLSGNSLSTPEANGDKEIEPTNAGL
ncbi:E3 ubiquitin-protein ligase rad18 [Borealophlyctis nickersoniae]|nr:E3 ubiquitin-protein ligase rad18 [Borealophlyctis nickersoniae]